ncbi:MAG: hypothetical protein NC205_04655 [Prevotella sp.]|nr:hypothetical protein [Alistipes senegalensis]MCM1357864.1 hypothetical protein [Prevotella sp.]MCM1473005.1 hypothetical protein [Muribaculaceae bacterium]
MKQSLDSFGEDYKYPVYASIDCRNSFFRSYNTKAGFLAVTDTGKLFVDEYYAMGTEKKYIFHVSVLKSLKIRKFPLFPIYSIKSLFMADGKKFRLDMLISLKVYGHEFTEQAENVVNFIETLKNWHINNSGGEL